MIRRTTHSAVPTSVADPEKWPFLRRVFRLPDKAAAKRIEAWNSLARVGEATVAAPQERPGFPGVVRAGIFGASRVYWHNMLATETRIRVFDGYLKTGRGVRTGSLSAQYGPLVVSKRIGMFVTDLREIEGICASKSAEYHFDSVVDFGERYCRFEGKLPSDELLSEMLAWDQVRIRNPGSSDHFVLTLWDPRLFVANDGGSHHLAAAVYIAESLQRSTPITAKLVLSYFNPPVWEKLLQDYVVMQEGERSAGWSRYAVAELLGACHFEKIAGNVSRGTFVLLPRHDAAIHDVVGVLESRGAVDVTELFGRIVADQGANMRRILGRWPALASHLDAITG